MMHETRKITYGLLRFLTALILAFAYTDTLAQAGRNPILTGADPHAIIISSEYWIYPTHSADTGKHRAPDRFLGYASKDLVNWEKKGELIQIDEISWIKDDGAERHYLWAPAMATKNGKYYLYYSVGPQNPTPSRIGVAVSDYPSHGFKDIGRPLITGGNGFEAIDPMVYSDSKSGETYLYAGGSAGSTLRVYKLKPNMIEVDREIKVEQPPKFTEGAFMHQRKGIYYLSYSHGSWNNSSYSVHYATSKTPVGPWQYRGPILVSDSTRKGPGHHSFVNPAKRKWFIVYHRWEQLGEGPYRGSRKTAVERISYTKDGAIVPIKMSDTIKRKVRVKKSR